MAPAWRRQAPLVAGIEALPRCFGPLRMPGSPKVRESPKALTRFVSPPGKYPCPRHHANAYLAFDGAAGSILVDYDFVSALCQGWPIPTLLDLPVRLTWAINPLWIPGAFYLLLGCTDHCDC
jgi:hypothetical protein